jgi:hypothetical protein
MTAPVYPLSTLTPLLIQEYERYLPTAFNEELTILQKVNKIIQFLNKSADQNQVLIDQWNALVTWIQTGIISDQIQDKLNGWLADGTLESLTLGRFKPVGDTSLETDGSFYIPNDFNIFGRKSDNVSFSNLITMEQNNLVKVGDYDTDAMWLMSGVYQSFRAPLSPAYQQIDSQGNAVGTSKTMKHQGNSSNHLFVFGVGNHTCMMGEWIELHTLTNVGGQFPPNSYNNFAYTIPRDGMYDFTVTLKLSDQTPVTTKGAIRIAVSLLRGGVATIGEMATVHYDPTTDLSPFLSASFKYKYNLGDQITIKIKPINENITLEEGTRLHLYGLGDTIQA